MWERARRNDRFFFEQNEGMSEFNKRTFTDVNKLLLRPNADDFKGEEDLFAMATPPRRSKTSQTITTEMVNDSRQTATA